MLIEVTKEHIKNGAPEDECNCPIALAIQDHVEMELDDDVIDQANIIVTVHDNDINVHHHNNNAEMDWLYGVSPKDKDEWNVISDFIYAFDNGKEVKPFTIEMERNN